MGKKVAVLLLVAFSWTLMGPQIVNHQGYINTAGPAWVCQWLPFVCRY